MKMFKLYTLAVSLLMLVACGGDDKGGSKTPSYEGERLEDITNFWKLVSVNGVEPEFSVYVEFFDGIFYIYQQIYTLGYVVYEGNYSIDYNIVSGVYADGSKWKCSYVGELSELGDTLTMVSQEENPITNVYEVCEIPEYVIEEAETRSSVDFDYHF